ncbi:MAG: hypothetical protein JXB38_10600 [Anaerolineales bacterium]|nr:hypothetical protein [Anaerolineales bacterium]
MQTEKRTMAPWVFYTLVSTITSAVFGLIGLLGLLLAGILSVLAAMILAIMYLFLGIIIGLGIGAFAKRLTKEMKVKGFGLFQGRLAGLFVGGMVGGEIANCIGAVLGALAFYFLGRWMGPKVSCAVANWIERSYIVPEVQPDRVVSKGTGVFPSVFFLMLPFFFLFVEYMVSYFQIEADFMPEYLTVGRVIAILISALVLGLPWLLKFKARRDIQSDKLHPIDFPFFGVVLSIIPSFYGFILFFFGASMLEYIPYAAVSVIAGIIWLVYESRNRTEEFPQAESEEDHDDQNNIGV